MGSGKYALKDGTEYLPPYNFEPGMNDDLAYEDRAGWQTSVAMLTGGQSKDWDDLAGPEVAPSNYEMDPMGEERGMATFKMPQPAAMGHIGMLAAEGGSGMQKDAATTSGGKSTHLAPQNYNENLGYPRKN